MFRTTSGHLAALQLDDDAQALAVRLVAQVGDPLERLVAHQLGDLLDQLRLVDLVRDLGDDDRAAVALGRLLDGRLRADGERRRAPSGTPARCPTRPTIRPPVGKSGPGMDLHQAVGTWRRASRLVVLDQPDDAVHHLAQVVRRDVGGHADGDADRPVDEQVREGRRQDGRLLGRLVVVGDEVDRLLLEVGHHLLGQRLQAGLGVPHGRGRVAVHRAEVPLAVHQGRAHVEVLREPDQRVVDGGVAVRVEVAHHLADDLGALAVGPVARQPHRPHAVEHAAVRRLQAVAHVGKRPPDDHAHGVIHVRALHLVFDVDRELRCGECHVQAGGSGLTAQRLDGGRCASRAAALPALSLEPV